MAMMNVDRLRKSFSKKNIIYLSFFVFTSIICFGLFKYSSSVYDVRTLYGNTKTTTAFELRQNVLISQVFEAYDLRGAGVNFESIVDVEEIPNVDVEIKLFENDTNIEIASTVFNTLQTGVGAKELMNPTGDIYKEGSGIYRLEVKQLTSDGSDKRISVLTEQSPASEDPNIMKIDGVSQFAKLSVTALENIDIDFIPFFSILLMITVMMTIYMILEKKPIEKVFIVIFLGLGVIYSLLMSPFVIPDEATHYDRAYSLSNKITGYDDIMRRKEDLSLFTYLHTPDKNSVKDTLDHMLSISSSNEMVEGTVIHSKGNKVIPYIVPAMGITMGKFLHLGAYPMFYLGRLCNLLLTSILIYFAIKLIPVGKCILFVVSLFPMTVHLAGSYSYDGLVISSTMLFVSYIMYLKYTKRAMDKKDFVVLTVLPLLFLSAKSFGYMAFLLLLGMLPWKETFKKQKKEVLLFVAISSISFLYVSGTLSLIQSLILPSAPSASADADSLSVPMHTYGDVLKSPFKYMIMVSSTLYRNIEVYIKDMVGNNLCWYTFPIKEFYIYIYLILLLFTGLNREIEFKFKSLDRWIIGTAGILTCGIVVLSMAIAFTPEGMNSIIGVQGRYFIPTLILLILFVYNIGVRLDRNITAYLLYATLVLQSVTVMDVLLNIMRI